MHASIRELKSHLSEYIRQVRAGETVTISVHNRPVAQIVPIKRQTTLDELAAQPGISWNGGRAVGLPRGEALPVGMSLADWVAEDRR
ncbi:MAG: type II toxin-antitoxin system prevent-host-death family antitoxin [Sulfuritalea sp.]|nr:type II toxin-antitoxin system prevent-host-death family antitoxin [Sulfuritalea sp.]